MDERLHDGGEGGAHSFVISFHRHLTVDRTSFSRGRTLPTLTETPSTLGHSIRFFDITRYELFMRLPSYLSCPLWPLPIS